MEPLYPYGYVADKVFNIYPKINGNQWGQSRLIFVLSVCHPKHPSPTLPASGEGVSLCQCQRRLKTGPAQAVKCWVLDQWGSMTLTPLIQMCKSSGAMPSAVAIFCSVALRGLVARSCWA